jgi:hypothetical protein
MKRILVFLAGLGLMAPAVVPSAQVDLGISVSDGRLRSFYLAIGDHYRVDPRAVLDIRTRYRLLDEELPVVFFLAARAQVSPRAVIDLRLAKRSWFEIAVHFGLSPDIFFVPVALEKIGPPYGNAYGYYRKFGRAGNWRSFKPADREIVDLVNLRFLSEYHHLAPDSILNRRARGESFVKIHGGMGRGNGPDAPSKKPKASKGGKPGKAKKKK